MSLWQPLDRGRRGRNGGGHRPVLQRAGRVRGQPRRTQASRRHRLESRRPALEAVMSTRRRPRARIAARNERGPERAGVEGVRSEVPSVRKPAELPDGVSQATIGVRGGLLRSGFDETAEAMYLTSGYVY